MRTRPLLTFAAEGSSRNLGAEMSTRDLFTEYSKNNEAAQEVYSCLSQKLNEDAEFMVGQKKPQGVGGVHAITCNMRMRCNLERVGLPFHIDSGMYVYSTCS